MSADVLGLLEQHGLEKAVVVGHSMGGKVAIHMALHHPERVSGVAVVDMAPVAYKHRFDEVFDGFAAVDLKRLNNRSDADEQMARHIDQPGVRAFLLQNLHSGPEGWSWRCNLDALQQGQELITAFEDEQGRTYQGPASFIHGTRSDYLLPAHMSAVKALFPAATRCPVEDAGHWVFAENPIGFMHCLEAFLQPL